MERRRPSAACCPICVAIRASGVVRGRIPPGNSDLGLLFLIRFGCRFGRGGDRR